MAQHELLNNVSHQALRVQQKFGSEWATPDFCVPIYPVEFRHAQAHYPLVFAKGADDSLQPVALLGFERGENLFVKHQQWDVQYRPLLVEKGPFLIGRSEQGESLSIHVDVADPRINTQDGEAIFLPHGGNSDYIENIANVLSTIHESQAAVKAFVDTLLALDLIESFVLDVALDNEQTHRLSGFSTINEEKLAMLDASTLHDLHQQGYLSDIYMMLASHSHIRDLVERRRAKEAS